MANIIHLMGPTCAGKSTIIDTLVAMSDTVHPVQIGKILRKKYGEAHFKGQGAPAHTQNEALQLYFDTIKEGIALGKEIILVDGQPRDVAQAREMIDAWDEHELYFMLITADHTDREDRARKGRAPGPDLDLAISRLTNDYRNCYEVITELLANGIEINVVNTSAPNFSTAEFCQEVVDQLG